MKSLSLCLMTLMTVFSLSVMAYPVDDPSVVAKKAFLTSPRVKRAVRRMQAEGYTDLAKEPLTMLIRGGCGFAGCDSEYIVSLAGEIPHSQQEFKSVVAQVRVPAIGDNQVTLLKLRP